MSPETFISWKLLGNWHFSLAITKCHRPFLFWIRVHFLFLFSLLCRWVTRARTTWSSARRWVRSAPGNSPRSVVAPRKRHNRRRTAGATASSRKGRAMTVTTSPRTPSTRRRYTCCGHTAIQLARASDVNFDRPNSCFLWWSDVIITRILPLQVTFCFDFNIWRRSLTPVVCSFVRSSKPYSTIYHLIWNFGIRHEQKCVTFIEWSNTLPLSDPLKTVPLQCLRSRYWHLICWMKSTYIFHPFSKPSSPNYLLSRFYHLTLKCYNT